MWWWKASSPLPFHKMRKLAQATRPCHAVFKVVLTKHNAYLSTGSAVSDGYPWLVFFDSPRIWEQQPCTVHTNQHKSPQLPVFPTWPPSGNPPAWLSGKNPKRRRIAGTLPSAYLCCHVTPSMYPDLGKQSYVAINAESSLRNFPRTWSPACLFFLLAQSGRWRNAEIPCSVTGCSNKRAVTVNEGAPFSLAR